MALWICMYPGGAMKKFIIFLILAIFFAVSCGGSKKTESGESSKDNKSAIGENSSGEDRDEYDGYYDEEDIDPDDLPLEEAVCYNNPCKNMPNSTGKCEFDGDNSYICHCEKNFFWQDYKCVSPCDDNPCDAIKNSDGCYAEDRKTFGCNCITNYFWDGEACLNPCDASPCQEHAKCYPYDSVRYGCGCDDNFFEEKDECVSPCEPNPCKKVGNSTGKCTAKNLTSYTCECKDNYVFTSDNECVSPCEPNPCAGLENSTEKCNTIDTHRYSCGCNKDFYWSDETGGCLPLQECSEENNEFCKDSESKLIWSPRAGTIEQPGYVWALYIEDAKKYCESLKEGGFTNWRLPTIDELRTLVVNCPKLETGGTCKVSEKKHCISADCYNESSCLCEGESSSDIFSKFGYERYAQYWSSSSGAFEYSYRNWLIELEGYANVFTFDPFDGYNDHYASVRCVRK